MTSIILNNKKPNLLNHLKRIKNSEQRLEELRNPINEDKLKSLEIDFIQLKRVLPLFPEHHSFIAFKLLVERFVLISNTEKLNKIELVSTQIISILSLFHTINRCIALQLLIKKFSTQQEQGLKNLELKSSQLKAILFLFDTSDRFAALNLLKNNFGIKIQLTESDIKELETCLSRDLAFNNLLPMAKKKFWDSFFTTDKKLPDVHSMQNKTQYAKLNSSRVNTFSNQVNPLKKAIVNRNKPLKRLSLHTVKTHAKRGRFKFLKNYVKVHGSQSILFKNIEEFQNFIKIFPPHDAIELLNLPYINDQIKSLQQQKVQLSKESYNDLVSYLQNDSAKKFLRPISPNADTKLLQPGMFKEKNSLKLLDSIPDIVTSHNSNRMRVK